MRGRILNLDILMWFLLHLCVDVCKSVNAPVSRVYRPEVSEKCLPQCSLASVLRQGLILNMELFCQFV